MIETIYCKDDSLMDRFLIDIDLHGLNVDWDWYDSILDHYYESGLDYHWLNIVDKSGVSIHNHNCQPCITRELTSRNYLITLKMVINDKETRNRESN